MRLCFGVYATILKYSCPSSSNMKIVSDLISTIDPDHLLSSADTVSKLINCKNSFASQEIVEGNGALNNTKGSLTTAVPKSFSMDVDILAQAFEKKHSPCDGGRPESRRYRGVTAYHSS